MSNPQNNNSDDAVVSMFTLFFIGTLCLFSFILLPLPASAIRDSVRTGLLLVGVFSYEAVAILVIKHYYRKVKMKAVDVFNSNPKLVYGCGVALLCITYVGINIIIEQSFWKTVRDVIAGALILVAMPHVYEYVNKKHAERLEKNTVKREPPK